MGLADGITRVVEQSGGEARRVVNAILLVTLGMISVRFILRPARNAEQAIHRCIWPIGAFTLLTQNLFPWYLLWLVPLLALFLRSGRLGLRLDAWSVWFLFSGLIALAYTFFILWRPVMWAQAAQFVPFYMLLIVSAIWRRFGHDVKERLAGFSLRVRTSVPASYEASCKERSFGG
jgi:hypothetical protein